jgi:predicted methyltransferase
MFGECGRRVVPTVFGLLVLFVVVTNIEAQPAPDYAALLAAADRSDADREADKRRNPAPFLAFADLRPGMKVLDMGAGGGYSTELIARAVAPGGVVLRSESRGFAGETKGYLRSTTKDSRNERCCGRYSTL